MAAKRAYEAAICDGSRIPSRFYPARVPIRQIIPSDAAVHHRRYLDAGLTNSVEQRSWAQQSPDRAIREQPVRHEPFIPQMPVQVQQVARR